MNVSSKFWRKCCLITNTIGIAILFLVYSALILIFLLDCCTWVISGHLQNTNAVSLNSVLIILAVTGEATHRLKVLTIKRGPWLHALIYIIWIRGKYLTLNKRMSIYVWLLDSISHFQLFHKFRVDNSWPSKALDKQPAWVTEGFNWALIEE
jgi:hypothetical protein